MYTLNIWPNLYFDALIFKISLGNIVEQKSFL